MIPATPNEWTLDVIKDLVQSGIDENDAFEFKAQLDEHGSNIRKAACSFANSRGGFLVFGVRNSGSPEARLCGVEAAVDYPARLQRTLAKVEPSLDFSTREPPISVTPDRKIVVAHFPRSVRGPHWDPDERRFWRRGQGTSIHMSHEEIRMAFVDQAERLRRVKLVYLSLIDNWTRMENIVARTGSEGLLPLSVLDTNTIRSGIVDLHAIAPDLIETVMRVLRSLDIVTSRCGQMMMYATTPDTYRREVGVHHRREIESDMRLLLGDFNWILEQLRERFGFEKIKPRGAFEVPPLPPINTA